MYPNWFTEQTFGNAPWFCWRPVKPLTSMQNWSSNGHMQLYLWNVRRAWNWIAERDNWAPERKWMLVENDSGSGGGSMWSPRRACDVQADPDPPPACMLSSEERAVVKPLNCFTLWPSPSPENALQLHPLPQVLDIRRKCFHCSWR